jgi:hypothetical protein
MSMAWDAQMTVKAPVHDESCAAREFKPVPRWLAAPTARDSMFVLAKWEPGAEGYHSRSQLKTTT